MKKALSLVIIFLLLAAPVSAFLYELSVPSSDELKDMSDSALIEFYINVLIERKAAEAFHGKAGFSPKEYNKFKDILGLIVTLHREMVKREIEAPPVDEWLR